MFEYSKENINYEKMTEHHYTIILSDLQRKELVDIIRGNEKLRNMVPFATNYLTKLDLSGGEWIGHILEHYDNKYITTARILGFHIIAAGALPSDKVMFNEYNYKLLVKLSEGKIDFII